MLHVLALAVAPTLLLYSRCPTAASMSEGKARPAFLTGSRQLFLMGGGGGSSRPAARKDRSAEPGIQSNASMGAGACSFRTTVTDR